LVKAVASVSPEKKNGTERTRNFIKKSANAAIRLPAISNGMNGMFRSITKLIGMARPKQADDIAISFKARSGCEKGALSVTRAPLAAIPNNANEIAMKAKWYHIVTEKMRVSRISKSRVDIPTRPIAVSGIGASRFSRLVPLDSIMLCRRLGVPSASYGSHRYFLELRVPVDPQTVEAVKRLG
jgi:hypothetical protein